MPRSSNLRRVRRSRGGSVVPAQAADQAGRIAVGIVGQPVPDFQLVQPARGLVQAFQQRVDQGGIDRGAPVADRGQHVFRRMEHPGHRLDAEHAGRALQGVEHPEDADDQLAVLRRPLQRYQAARPLGDQVAAFQQELFEQGVHAGIPVSTAACSARSAGVTGLTR